MDNLCKNQECLISIIIPMYNSEKNILKTLSSVTNQTYRNIEIIIVDDGSTDNSAVLVNKINDSRIRYYYQSNSGVSIARNRGIDLSNGEYITFIDSDDIWDENILKKHMMKIKETKSNLCYCGTLDYYEEKNIYKKEKIYFTNRNVQYEYLKKNTWPQTGSWIVEKRIINENNIKFKDRCSWGEDYEFLFKLMCLSKVEYIDEYLFTYVRRAGSLSSFNKEHIKEVENLNRLNDWVNNTHSLDLDKELIKNIIFKYRIPSVVSLNLYKGLKIDKSFILDNIEFLSPYISFLDELNIKNIKYGNKRDYIKNLIFKYLIKNKYLLNILLLIKNKKKRVGHINGN